MAVHGYVNTSNFTLGQPTYTVTQAFDWNRWQLEQALAKLRRSQALNGTKPIVVCNGGYVECADMDAAKAKAEELAHQGNANAFILKPVLKVAPKRDVVTTEL